MGISFGSINTGLPKDIVQKLMEAEKIPLKKLEERKQKVEDKKALLGDLTARVEKMRGEVLKSKGEKSFRELLLKSSDDRIIDGTVDKNLATPGTYNIEVLQLAQKSSAISNGVEDKNETYVGVGYIQYELPNGETRDVYIDEAHSSLSGIAKLINTDKENGMHATVVNDGKDGEDHWRIIISLEETGDNNKANFPYLYLVDGEVDLYLDGHRDARDAKIMFDGFELELPSNQANDLIPGVTLDLKRAKPGEEITIEIEEDTKKIVEKINTLIESINEVLKFIKEQNAMDENTDTSRTLGGDLTLQTIESRIRTAVFSTVNTKKGPARLGDMGVQFQRNGLLAFEQERFENLLEKDYLKVAQVLTGYFEEGQKINGFVDNLENVVNSALQNPSGTLFTRKKSFDSNIRDIDRRVENKQRQLERKEENLKLKFARLEETIARIRTQGSGLAGLQGGAAADPIQQLG